MPSSDIVNFLLGPASLLTQGLIQLFIGLAMNAMQVWLIYEIITTVPTRSKNLIEAIDAELTQNNYYQNTGLRYRVYGALLQVFLPLLLITVCYLSFCLFTQIVMDLF